MTDEKKQTPKPLEKRDLPRPGPLHEEKSNVITDRNRDPRPYPGDKQPGRKKDE